MQGTICFFVSTVSTLYNGLFLATLKYPLPPLLKVGTQNAPVHVNIPTLIEATLLAL